MDISILDKQRIIVIIRHNKPFDVEGLFQCILGAGLNVIEITLNTPQSYDLINTAVNLFGSKMLIGAGTVLTLAELKKAIDIGVRFIVSPVFNQEIVEYCINKGIPAIPGALTPTEIYNAYSAGAYMVKVFPAELFGPSYFKIIKAPLSNLKLVAVGGVRENTVNEFFLNGANAVAIGASIIKPEWVENKDYDSIKENITKFCNAILY